MKAVPLAGGNHVALGLERYLGQVSPSRGRTSTGPTARLARVSSVPRKGGTPTTLVSGVNDPTMLVTTPSTMFWLDPADDAVLSAPLAGGTATTIATGQVGLAGIATDGTSVYWTAQGTGNTTGTVMKLTPN